MLSITRNPEVLVQIKTANELLVSSGVNDYCLKCIRGPVGGCCQGCNLLGTDGCTNKPLSCTLWLCHGAAKMFPEVAKTLYEYAAKFPPDVSFGMRENSLDAEQQLL